MKSTITALSLFLVGMLANAQTTNRTVSSFSKIEIDGNIELVYTETLAPSIKVETENESNLITQINDGILKISLENKSTETMKVYVTGNSLHSIKAESGAKVTVKNQLSTAEFNLALLSGATFKGHIDSAKRVNLRAENNTIFIGRIDTELLSAKFTSNAKAVFSGTAAHTDLSTDNRALCLAGNFASEKMSVRAESFSTVKTHVKNEIDIKVSENGKVTYSGTPTKVNMNESAMALASQSAKPIAAN